MRDEFAQELTRDLLVQRISGQIDEINENDVLEYRRTTDLSSTDVDWLNSELYALLATKTADTAMTSIKSLDSKSETVEQENDSYQYV